VNRTARNILILSSAVLLAGAQFRAQAQQPKNAGAQHNASSQFTRAKPAPDANAYPSDTSTPDRFFKPKPKNAEELDRYIENSSGRLLVKIGTSWCSPCRAMDQSVRSLLSTGLNDVDYLPLDVDTVNFAASRLMAAPTLIVRRIGKADTSNIDGWAYFFAQPIIAQYAAQPALANAARRGMFSSIAKLRTLKAQGERVKFTIDGTTNFVAVLEGAKIGIYDAATYGKRGMMYPIWVLFEDGKRVAEGATFDLQKDQEFKRMLQAIIDSLAHEPAAPGP